MEAGTCPGRVNKALYTGEHIVRVRQMLYKKRVSK